MIADLNFKSMLQKIKISSDQTSQNNIFPKTKKSNKINIRTWAQTIKMSDRKRIRIRCNSMKVDTN